MTERYTDEEIELIRRQLRRGNELAREEVKRRGVKVHPRIAAKRANGESEEQK